MAKHDLDPQDSSSLRRTYVIEMNGGIFHRTDCDEERCYERIAAQPPDRLSFSDSSEALMTHGMLPCPLCCAGGERGNEMIQKLRQGIGAKVHETFAVDSSEIQ